MAAENTNCSRKVYDIYYPLRDMGREMPTGIRLELEGKKFGRLTVMGLVSKRGPSKWIAECECGVVKEYAGKSLMCGNTKSCGCYARDVHSVTARRTKTIHGRSHTFLHGRWSAMINRCTNPNSPIYKNYGARGIKVCERWMTFVNFLADVGEIPPGKTLDRIDVNGDYEPANVRWATTGEQSLNRRDNRLITVDGVTRAQSQWAEISENDRGLIASRLKLGWEPRRAIFTPPRPMRREARFG